MKAKCPRCGKVQMTSDRKDDDDLCGQGLTWTCGACKFKGKADAFLFNPPASWYFHPETVEKIKKNGRI